MTDQPLDENSIVAALRREFDAAESCYGHLRQLQDDARRYYEARPFGNEEDGRSQIVLPDVQESCDYMAASVLRTFVSSDHVVEFEATDEADEDVTADATAAINYNFMRQQDGYRILHDVATDGLLEKYGVFKSMMTTKEDVSRHQVQITHPMHLGMIPDEMEVEDFDFAGDGTGIASLKHTQTKKEFIDVPVPSEEFRFSPRASHEDTADYLAHVCRKTRSELVEMGFDREQVYELPGHAAPMNYSRDLYTGHEAESSPALQEVLLCEEYARMDVDNDGIAERIKVYRVENVILKRNGQLAIETVDDQPFSVFCPFPRPHRLVGYSLADKVMDLQLARSTIARQLFDGMYNANMPRPIVDTSMMDDNTLDDLLNPIPGSPIRAKGGAGSIQPYQTSFDVGKSLQVLEWITGERESRTGITRLNQGLDADALNKTATGTAMMQAQGQQQEEFVARNLAEAVGRMFAKKYRLMKAEGDPFKIKVDGNYKTVDPSQWPDDINVVIRVGLGSGSKDKRIQYRMALAPMLAEGFANKLVSADKIFNAMDGLARDMGIGTGDDIWDDPSAQDAAPASPEPNPEADKAAHDMQVNEAKLQLQAQDVQGKQEIAQQKLLSDHQNKQAKVEADYNLALRKANMEGQLDIHRQGMEFALAMQQARLKSETDKHIAKNRPGGKLDA